MAQRLPILIHLENFEGPLDLLLYLIQMHELDISKVSIAKITDQYLVTLQVMGELNFDIASEFLLMAATLIYWKSKALLPQVENQAEGSSEDDTLLLTPEGLVRQLLLHQLFTQAGQDLLARPVLGEEVFTRSQKKAPIERIWKQLNVTDLILGYQDLLVRARRRTTVLRKETVSVSDQMIAFSKKLENGKLIELKALLSLLPQRAEWVGAFLASLEMARLKKIRVHQNKVYDPIYLEAIEDLTGFNPYLEPHLETFA